ncbi:hypothetical protein [Natrinema salsiterrestre]|uniref:Uncharacterized protein n=1 Tax=Natrinema salsiterrestre TaxID=2950540 RepID=A0A9Q4L1B3_9EURY|nr:hypothetical protein [Natrinema salsiterrestre]MDF9745749.1 hypothetical protein [Natrinema salsiterrestre]
MEHGIPLPVNVAASTRETVRRVSRILVPIAIVAVTTGIGLLVFFELVSAFPL